jgi:hypothetical protein
MNRIAILLLVLPCFASCASIKTELMVTEQASFGAQYPATVSLTVGGGSAGVKWFSGTIEPEELDAAIRQSLETSILFAEVVSGEPADYALDADLTYASSHPGLNLTAWVAIQWTLTERASEDVAWTTEIRAKGEASVGEAFNATSRQYRALEKGTRANIDQAFAEIAGLGLGSP